MFNEQDYDKIIAATVYDRDGDKIGRAGRLYLDDETNQPTFITVNTGFFGTSESFIPLDDATLNGDRLEVPYEKAHIKNAPHVDPDGHLDPAEEEALYRHYNRDYSQWDGGQADVGREQADVGGRVDVDVDRGRGRGREDAATLTAAEERLDVGTERVEAGKARLRKHVTTEQQTVTVPVEKEVLTVEREAVTGDTRTRDRIGDHVDEAEDIVLREERPVVSKDVHETERVSVGKQTVTEQEQVSGQVQKEHIEVEGDAVRGEDRRI
jgi:uncharacterized protein (TIGR02271 family)